MFSHFMKPLEAPASIGSQLGMRRGTGTSCYYMLYESQLWEIRLTFPLIPTHWSSKFRHAYIVCLSFKREDGFKDLSFHLGF